MKKSMGRRVTTVAVTGAIAVALGLGPAVAAQACDWGDKGKDSGWNWGDKDGKDGKDGWNLFGDKDKDKDGWGNKDDKDGWGDKDKDGWGNKDGWGDKDKDGWGNKDGKDGWDW